MKINYEIKLLSPAITAKTGTIGKEIDVEVKKDVNGKPYFSAKHIKGIFRGKVLEFRNVYNDNDENYLKKIFDFVKDNKEKIIDGEKFAKEYFGDEGNKISKIRFSNVNLKLKNEDEKEIKNKIGSRYGVKINRKTKVAEDNSLFNYEFVKTGNIYEGYLEINKSDFYERKEDLKFLLSSFLHINKIGGLKSRGLGKIEISFVSVDGEELEKLENNNRFEAVDKIIKLIENKKNSEKKELGELKKYKYTLNFEEPIVLQGKINKNEVELRHSLQGSTIRGAIIQYGLDNNFEIEKLLKINIEEIKINGEKKLKLASGFETKYPVKNGNKKKVDKTISLRNEYKEGENEIKLERDSLALLKGTGTEISIKIDEKTRTTQEGLLFSTEYIELKKDDKIKFEGVIEIPEGLFEANKKGMKEEKKKKYELKIGKYKAKGFGKVKIEFEEYTSEENKDIKSIENRINELNEQIKQDFERIEKENNEKSEDKKQKISEKDMKLKDGSQKLITFDFLSDMILPFNEVENVGKQILQLFENVDDNDKSITDEKKSFENIGEKLVLNEKRTFVNVEKLRGYNIVNQLRKMDEIVITQGSVISYCVNCEEVKNILDELEKIEKNGIGLRRNEGFGRVRICSERKFEK